MTEHRVATREEWLAARVELLAAEKDLTRQGDEVARRRQQLPWVKVDKVYRFSTPSGDASLRDLFGNNTQLIVYHFMFGPDWEEGCPSCSSVADGFDETVVHLQHHDVAFTAVSRAPIDMILAYKARMGWSFPWVSSHDSDFNFDFGASFTAASIDAGDDTYNFRDIDASLRDPANLPAELPGMSAFAREGDTVFHTYSAYARGLDGLWPMWQWLDRAPMGRNEGDFSWFRRHDRYGTTA